MDPKFHALLDQLLLEQPKQIGSRNSTSQVWSLLQLHGWIIPEDYLGWLPVLFRNNVYWWRNRDPNKSKRQHRGGNSNAWNRRCERLEEIGLAVRRETSNGEVLFSPTLWGIRVLVVLNQAWGWAYAFEEVRRSFALAPDNETRVVIERWWFEEHPKGFPLTISFAYLLET